MKKINDLSEDELKIVWEKNSKLRDDVRRTCEDNDMYLIGEILDILSESLDNWSVGFYNNNYIKIKDGNYFIFKLNSVCEKYCFLSIEDSKYLNYGVVLINRLNCMDCDNKRFDMLENKINDMAQVFKEKVIEEFNKMTMPLEYDYLLENFIEFYVEQYLNDDKFYIDDEYMLYEKIIKSYA